MRAGRRLTLFISNEDTNDIMKIIKSLEDLGVLIDGLTKTVKHEMKKQEGAFTGAFLALLDASLVKPVISSIVKGINAKEVKRAGRGYIDKIF